MEKIIGTETKKIVVLGGSFNPPTIAHVQLMQRAIAAVGAEKGVFVPAPYWYVERKLRKSGCRQDALSDEIRMEMLEAICHKNSHLEICDYEIYERESRGMTYETLEKIQSYNPGSEIYFVAGSDKLHIIPRWHRVREFLVKFKILVAKRGGEFPEEIIRQVPFLESHREAFIIFDVSDEMDGISSSEFRKKIKSGEKTVAQAMVPEEVWNIMECNGKTEEACIDQFRGEYRFLSNFYPVNIKFEGIEYQNTEAAFQAQKCMTEQEKWRFTTLDPNKAKRLGRQIALRADWEDVKVDLMEKIVRIKFMQNPELAEKLLATGQKVLIEGNTWGDKFWGVDMRDGQGENHLGKILMKVREKLRKK